MVKINNYLTNVVMQETFGMKGSHFDYIRRYFELKTKTCNFVWSGYCLGIRTCGWIISAVQNS